MKNINYLVLCALLSSYNATANPFSAEATQDTHTIPNIFHDVRAGNKEAIRKRLENCEDCTEKDEQGNNVLHIAAERGDTEIVEILTTAPEYLALSDWLYAFLYAPTLPNINDTNNNGDTPLHCTINGNRPNNTHILLKNNASVETVNRENLSALFAAVKHDASHFIPIFVAHKLDLNNHRRNGDTIFHYAIKEDKPKTVRYCAQETSLIDTSNNNNKTPAFLAIDTENIDLLKLLHSGLNIPARNGVKPIHYATENGKYNAIHYIMQNNIPVDEPDHEGNPALFYANNKDMMNYLLSCGADIQKRNNKGEDVFAITSRNKNSDLAQYLAQLPGIDINARDNKGQTSFMRSSMAQDYEGMQRLINMGVNIRITDTMNENALHKIARIGSDKGATIILNYDNSLLIDRNKDGLTPLSVAAQQKNHADLLALLIAYKADVNTEDNNGLTPLHHAAAHDNIDAMVTLQNHGALCTQRTNKNNTIAHSAAEKGAINTLNYCIRLNAQLLSARNAYNETPFIIAAKNGSTKAVKALLRDTDFISKDIHRAMDLARKNGHRNTLTFLNNKVVKRTNECQEIAHIRATTLSLVSENKNALALLAQKNPAFWINYTLYSPASLNYYSKDQLYYMTDLERNTIKSLYLENQNKELNAKNDFNHSLTTIIKEEARIAAEKQAAERAHAERIRQQQQAELDRIAENNRIRHINEERTRIQERDRLNEQARATERARVQEAQQVAAQTRVECQDQVVNFQGQNVVMSMPINQNYPPQEDDEEQAVPQQECCICFEELPTMAIPCKNKHSDSICAGCLAKLTTCPFCRGSLTT